MKSWRAQGPGTASSTLLNGYRLRNGDERKRRQNWGRTELTWAKARRLGRRGVRVGNGDGEEGEGKQRRQTRDERTRANISTQGKFPHGGFFTAFIVTTESQHLKMKSLKCEGSVSLEERTN